MPKKSRREHVLNSAAHAAEMFIYYDRKEDEDLPRGEIEKAVAAGEVTKDEIVAAFADALGSL